MTNIISKIVFDDFFVEISTEKQLDKNWAQNGLRPDSTESQPGDKTKDPWYKIQFSWRV